MVKLYVIIPIGVLSLTYISISNATWLDIVEELGWELILA
jgi:hypothetical protein